MLAADEEVSNDHETLPGTRGTRRGRGHTLKEEEWRTVWTLMTGASFAECFLLLGGLSLAACSTS